MLELVGGELVVVAVVELVVAFVGQELTGGLVEEEKGHFGEVEPPDAGPVDEVVVVLAVGVEEAIIVLEVAVDCFLAPYLVVILAVERLEVVEVDEYYPLVDI